MKPIRIYFSFVFHVCSLSPHLSSVCWEFIPISSWHPSIQSALSFEQQPCKFVWQPNKSPVNLSLSPFSSFLESFFTKIMNANLQNLLGHPSAAQKDPGNPLLSWVTVSGQGWFWYWAQKNWWKFRADAFKVLINVEEQDLGIPFKELGIPFRDLGIPFRDLGLPFRKEKELGRRGQEKRVSCPTKGDPLVLRPLKGWVTFGNSFVWSWWEGWSHGTWRSSHSWLTVSVGSGISWWIRPCAGLVQGVLLSQLCLFHCRGQNTEPGSEGNSQEAAGWRNSASGVQSRDLHQRAHRVHLDVPPWQSEWMEFLYSPLPKIHRAEKT